MPILHPTAILVASEAMATSKWPRRSHLTSELNSVTSITYVAILLLPLTASSHPILPDAKHDIFDQLIEKWGLPRDGKVTYDEELSFNYLLSGEELGNFSYFSYSCHYKDLAQEVT